MAELVRIPLCLLSGCGFKSHCQQQQILLFFILVIVASFISLIKIYRCPVCCEGFQMLLVGSARVSSTTLDQARYVNFDEAFNGTYSKHIIPKTIKILSKGE